MKVRLITAFVFFLAVVPAFAGGTADTVNPTVKCIVKEEPHPMLLGKYGCRVVGTNTHGKSFNNPVEFALVKMEGGGYGLYYSFHSPAGNKVGWEAFIIDGNEMVSPDGKRKFFTKDDGKVYFTGPSGNTFEMKRQ